MHTGKVIDLTHEGHGVVKIDRYPVFVPNALIEEEIEYKLIKVKKNFAIGKLLEVKNKSKDAYIITNVVDVSCNI